LSRSRRESPGLSAALALTALTLLLAAPATANDPSLRRPGAGPVDRPGAFRRVPPAYETHAARINADARAKIDAGRRDAMRSIDDGVLERLGNAERLPAIQTQRALEEDMAALRHREELRRIEHEAERWPGDPGVLGTTTRPALAGSAIEAWLLQRKGQLARDLEALGTRIEAPASSPELEPRGRETPQLSQ
jgi:hypothetical protein